VVTRVSHYKNPKNFNMKNKHSLQQTKKKNMRKEIWIIIS